MVQLPHMQPQPPLVASRLPSLFNVIMKKAERGLGTKLSHNYAHHKYYHHPR